MACSRRQFLQVIPVSLGCGALASALGGCDVGASVDGSVEVTGGQAVASFAQFPALATVGGGVVVSAGGVPVAIIRTASDAVVALSAVCTHAGCTVGYAGNQSLHCPCHGSSFSSTGAVTAGPASRPLERIAATLHAADVTLTGL